MPNTAPVSQSAPGNYNAQASDHSTAIVNVYQPAPPQPVDKSQLASALAKLATMPLDEVPELGLLPHGSRMLLAHNPLFVGRQDELLALAKTLKGGATAAIGQTAAATGLGGIGKTQLAVEFVHRYGRFFSGGVFWLSFASAESVPAEVAACGGVGAMDLRPDFGKLKQDDQVAAVLSKWQDGLPRLLVFDSCESQELLAKWRPPGGACRVLVTSLRAEWDPSLGVAALALDVLSRAEGVGLLRGFRPDLKAEDPHLDAIAAELGDLPLALHLAGSYLHRYAHSPLGAPAKLLVELRNPQLLAHQALTGAGEPYSPTGHELHVARTFAISYDQLRLGVETDVLARKTLANAASLAPGELIPRDLLLLTLKLGEAKNLLGDEALQRLAHLGLLESDKDGALRLHRLLGAFVVRLEADSEAVDAVEEVLLAEAIRIVTAGYPAPLLSWQVHLRWAALQAEQRNSTRSDDLYGWLGRYLQMVGNYPEARVALERALNIAEESRGSDQLKVAIRVNNLGTVLRDLGDFVGARAAYERALKIGESTLGLDHPNLAIRFSNLGLVLQDLGDLAGARAALERALKIDEAALGPDHPNVAIRCNNLALVLQDLGDLAGARAALVRALQINEVALGSDHPAVAVTVNNLGSVLRGQGDLAGARAAYERALTIDEAAFGLDHPNVAIRVNNIGYVLQDLGDLAGARAKYERALKINEVALGPNHPAVATAVNNLGRVLQDQGNLAEAHALLERALKIDETVFGSYHPNVATDLNNLGGVFRDLGDVVEARAAYARALRILESTLGPQHPNTKIVQQNLASLSRD